MSADPTKIEFIMRESDFKELDYVSGIQALAINIQTLFITEPGTYPSDPELGIGIRNFIHDILDQTTIGEIKRRAMAQIKKYIPSERIIDIKVEKIQTADDIKNGIENSIGVLIAIDPREGISELSDIVTIGLSFGNTKDGRVISNVFI